VDPVADPLLIRKSSRAETRARTTGSVARTTEPQRQSSLATYQIVFSSHNESRNRRAAGPTEHTGILCRKVTYSEHATSSDIFRTKFNIERVKFLDGIMKLKERSLDERL
jgi:hypothetical protein